VPSREHLLTEWCENLRLEVAQAVDEIDPEGLLGMGAPPEEYGGESDRLTSLVVRDELTEQSVLAVWERAFGPGSYLSRRPDMLTSLTQRLLEVRDRRPRSSP
jgi:hypothetical protein